MADQFLDVVRTMSGGDGSLAVPSMLRYACTTIPGTDHAGITLASSGSQPATIAATGELPLEIDHLQYSLGEGPCLAALSVTDLVRVGDLALDERFPRFAPRAVDLGVRSMLSAPMQLSDGERAALNLYSVRPGAFEPDHVALAGIFAAYVSLLLLNHRRQEKIMRLERALESNREIGVATGILMEQRRSNQTAAFERLVQASQNSNRRLRDVATEVNRTMQLPSLAEDPNQRQ